MIFCGLQKTTLLDYPEHVAATLFTGGCNFRCPFCHNSELLPANLPAQYTSKEILTFLSRRKGILEGVCITGGEPTLQPDLVDFIREIREMGYQVKLDTNGSRPEVLEVLLQDELLDYIAMDLKGSPANYSVACGLPDMSPQMLENIKKSVQLLLHASIPYEFRTTVVRELHSDADFLALGQLAAGCRAYYLQNYRDSEQVLQPGIFHACTRNELEHFADILRQTMPQVILRGVD